MNGSRNTIKKLETGVRWEKGKTNASHVRNRRRRKKNRVKVTLATIGPREERGLRLPRKESTPSTNNIDMGQSWMYSPSRMLTTHDIGKGSFCVSKVEVGRNLKKLFHLTFFHSVLYLKLPQHCEWKSENHRTPVLHETGILDRIKGHERKSLILPFEAPLGQETET